MSALKSVNWQWENATAGALAGLATVSFSHPLDVVRTRFQVSDGRTSNLPSYKNTHQAVWTIARTEGLRGLYAGFYPAVLGSTISWGLYFFFYSKAKQRYSKGGQELTPGLHLASAAEAGALSLLLHKSPLACENKIAASDSSSSGTSIYRYAVKTILKEEGWSALYKGIVPGLFLVTHGAIQFTAYEELRKVVVGFRSKESEEELSAAELLNTIDYATLGASSKLTAILLTYPFQVIRSQTKLLMLQRPSKDGIPIYMDSWHVVKETARFEGLRGFYKGITANMLKNIPAASITFIVYENVLNMLKFTRRND
ncbi:unnamed protein product [Camellia sinensis]